MLTLLKGGSLISRIITTGRRSISRWVLDDVEIRPISMEDIVPTAKIVTEEFFQKEPMSQHLNISPVEAWEYAKPMFTSCLNSKTSFGAFDKRTGEMAGVVLSSLGTTSPPEPDRQREYPLNVRQMYQVLEETNPNGPIAELGRSKYLDLFVITVKEEYAACGLGMEMSKRFPEKAREMGCEFAIVTCTSVYSRKIAEAMGLKMIRELVYEDYVDPITGEKIFKGIAKPHYASCLMYYKV